MKRGVWLAAIAVLLLLNGCAGIVFVSSRDGRGQIYSMDEGGSFQTNLSGNNYTEHFPDISPDGKWIVFSSFRNPPGENIYIMDLEGKNVRQVTTGTRQRIMPRWSPRDTIAYVYPAYTGNAEIWTVRSDGTEIRQVTTPGQGESDDGGHDFYDGGQMLVFSRHDRSTGERNLYTVAADGSGMLKRITDTPFLSEVIPVVSHDGKLLAYRAFYHEDRRDTLRVLNVGSWSLVKEIELQPPADKNISGLDFSADDRSLLVSVESSDVPGPVINYRQEIFSVKLDGTGQTRLTSNAAADYWPVSVAPLRQGTARIPVLFIHGHSRGAAETWRQPAGSGTTSFAAALEANPELGIDPFYLELPLHGDDQQENYGRSIADDAADILAMIEGGANSWGVTQTGILNMPAYSHAGKVAIVAYSQGAISSRYYLKNLMGSRRSGAVTVSEFVALAAPNHGTGGTLTCGAMEEPDRSRRQLCGGRTANPASQASPCGICFPGDPPLFTTNFLGDDTFLAELNGHDFGNNCDDATIEHPELEAPRSRPSTEGGILYINLYAADNADLVAGGETQSGDCMGRRLARNHAPDAVNMEISGTPTEVHGHFLHAWPVICATLSSIVNREPPSDPASACEAFTHP